MNKKMKFGTIGAILGLITFYTSLFYINKGVDQYVLEEFGAK